MMLTERYMANKLKTTSESFFQYLSFSGNPTILAFPSNYNTLLFDFFLYTDAVLNIFNATICLLPIFSFLSCIFEKC